MKDFRIVLLRWTAVLLVLAIPICSLLLTLRMKRAARTDINIPPQPSYATTWDRQLPEIRLEQLLNLDRSTGFDGDLTSLLKREREQQRAVAPRKALPYESVASVSHYQKGGHSQ